MKNQESMLALAATALAGAIVGGADGVRAQEGEPSCAAQGTISPICGVQAPEDLEIAPDGRHLFVTMTSGAARHTTGLGFASIDLATRQVRRMEPTVAPRRGWGDPACSAPTAIAPHGFHLSRRRDGRWQLLAVNHAGRESMEFYEVVGSGDRYGLVWRGCVEKFEGGNFNDVAATPTGFVASIPDPVKPTGARGLGGPMPTRPGHILKWTPRSGLHQIAGTEAAYPNGVHASKDGRFIFYAASRSGEILRLDRRSGTVTRKALPLHPDNISERADGKLVLGGIAGSSPDFIRCARQGTRFCPAAFAVVAVDQRSLAVTPVVSGPAGPAAGTTVAVQHGDRVFLGSVTSNRVVEVKAAP